MKDAREKGEVEAVRNGGRNVNRREFLGRAAAAVVGVVGGAAALSSAKIDSAFALDEASKAALESSAANDAEAQASNPCNCFPSGDSTFGGAPGLTGMELAATAGAAGVIGAWNLLKTKAQE